MKRNMWNGSHPPRVRHQNRETDLNASSLSLFKEENIIIGYGQRVARQKIRTHTRRKASNASALWYGSSQHGINHDSFPLDQKSFSIWQRYIGWFQRKRLFHTLYLSRSKWINQGNLRSVFREKLRRWVTNNSRSIRILDPPRHWKIIIILHFED